MNNFFIIALISLLFGVSLSAQTNNIGKPIPESYFGMTFYNNTVVPQLPHSTVRSWDTNHVGWNVLNPARGTYNWKTLDAWTNGHAGKDLVYTFGLTPTWAALHAEYATPYRTFSSCSMPMNISDWDTFVTAIATHVGEKVKYWELWNEPMNYQYWCKDANPAANFAMTGTMFRHAHSILKKIIPDAVILSPSIDKPFGLAWMKNYYANGGTTAWDIMAIHGYPDNPPEGIVQMLSQYTTYMAANGMANMPIWDTETAGAGSDGAWLTKMLLLSWSSGVSRTIWYGYDMGGALWSAATGLTEIGTGYSNVYKWLVGATLTSACGKDAAGTYTCPITRDGTRGEILWNSTSTVSVSVPSGMKQYQDLRGVTHPLEGGAVSIGNSPVLLEARVRRRT